MKPRNGLEALGLGAAGQVHWNLPVPALYEAAIRRGEGLIAVDGPLVCRTAPHTGRSPNDKFIVREPSSEPHIWWGSVNRPIDEAAFDRLLDDVTSHLAGRELFVQDCYAGADPAHRLRLRIVTEYAWHSLFARHLFIDRGTTAGAEGGDPDVTVIDVPSFRADPARHDTNSEVCILLHLARRLVVIGGTSYAGEIKKSVFTLMNYLLPLQGVLSMHCSANVGPEGDVALFFGLSGTGKTTLSCDSERRLIGDDEHGWTDRGVFNIEGGCYAKMIRLSPEAEPVIYATTRRFGTVLENVTIDPLTRRLDLDDDSVTENTRGAYPLSFIGNAVSEGMAGHPRHIVMLTADAFGVMPPIARLTPAGAMYHFLSGYTAKVAGTERGVTEPRATFSACFGAPFMVLHPGVYAKALGERIARHDTRVWLVNTGWTGGPYGTGRRIPLAHTRAMVRAALSGALDGVAYERDPVFNLDVPAACPGVPAALLRPRTTWSDPAAFDAQAARVAAMFVENFRAFETSVPAEVRAAGPRP
ncbi:MAG TPA: phosphoenolpyruvate carboxykinase [Vicinamibacterales bacterium]|nr:phosphoenolpyruvate carboxykinase [Vicinamibacterales bacterium]